MEWSLEARVPSRVFLTGSMSFLLSWGIEPEIRGRFKGFFRGGLEGLLASDHSMRLPQESSLAAHVPSRAFGGLSISLI